MSRRAGQRWSEMSLSAPVWVWGLYGLLIVGFCVLSGDVWPVFAAAFSFQFWTFAAWRGRVRAEGPAPENGP